MGKVSTFKSDIICLGVGGGKSIVLDGTNSDLNILASVRIPRNILKTNGVLEFNALYSISATANGQITTYLSPKPTIQGVSRTVILRSAISRNNARTFMSRLLIPVLNNSLGVVTSNAANPYMTPTSAYSLEYPSINWNTPWYFVQGSSYTAGLTINVHAYSLIFKG